MIVRLLSLATAALTTAFPAQSAVTIGDLIGGSADEFYGFEDLGLFSNFGPSTVSGNLTVTQINGDPGGTATGFDPGGREGARSWYANGGDRGYTRISTTDGTALSALSLLVGSGYSVAAGTSTAHYSLRLLGAEVDSGSFANLREFEAFTFDGVVFDELWMLATLDAFTNFGDGTSQALAIDSIRVQSAVAPVPLPAGGLLLAGTLALLGARRYQMKKT